MSEHDYSEAAVIALGGNLPGAYPTCADLLDAAVARLAQEPLTVLAKSPWWTSSAWPDPSAPPFLNGVVMASTGLAPLDLLDRLRNIERAFGRMTGERNAPRTLDLDLIAHGRAVMDSETLILPHPRAAQRLFVMGPLAQIAPNWRHPTLGQTAEILAGQASVGADAKPPPRA